jgi:hypothetical protein
MATEEKYTSSVELEVDDASDTLGDSTRKTISDTHQRLLLQQAGSRRVTVDMVAESHMGHSTTNPQA